MASKRLQQDLKSLRAGSINSKDRKSSQKKKLKEKFDTSINWQCTFVISIVEISTLMILLLNVLHLKHLNTKIVLSHQT